MYTTLSSETKHVPLPITGSEWVWLVCKGMQT